MGRRRSPRRASRASARSRARSTVAATRASGASMSCGARAGRDSPSDEDAGSAARSRLPPRARPGVESGGIARCRPRRPPGQLRRRTIRGPASRRRSERPIAPPALRRAQAAPGGAAGGAESASPGRRRVGGAAYLPPGVGLRPGASGSPPRTDRCAAPQRLRGPGDTNRRPADDAARLRVHRGRGAGTWPMPAPEPVADACEVLASGKPTTIHEIVQHVERVVHREPQLVFAATRDNATDITFAPQALPLAVDHHRPGDRHPPAPSRHVLPRSCRRQRAMSMDVEYSRHYRDLHRAPLVVPLPPALGEASPRPAPRQQGRGRRSDPRHRRRRRALPAAAGELRRARGAGAGARSSARSPASAGRCTCGPSTSPSIRASSTD